MFCRGHVICVLNLFIFTLIVAFFEYVPPSMGTIAYACCFYEIIYIKTDINLNMYFFFFRCSDWSLLDTLTWPVFVFQYLAIYGYTKGPEWKGFYDGIFYGEYYLLPASRKLMILQILCDDALASEELKAEMNMREESEFGSVGMDYDNEGILPAENGPRRVHPRYSKTTACKDSETKKYASELNAANLPGNSISHFRDTETTEDDVDGNGDECRLCGMDGTLLCCDGCPAVYHSRCIGVMKMYIPEGTWYCPECKINMIGPTIAQGTSLKGAEVFGKDLYGQVFMGTCDHLLVYVLTSFLFHLLCWMNPGATLNLCFGFLFICFIFCYRSQFSL